MRKILFIGFLVFAVLFYFSIDDTKAIAGSVTVKCAIQTFDAEYKNSKAVFVGKVIDVQKAGDKKIFKFEVSKFWKGIDSKTIKVAVSENMRYAAQYKPGGEYLVFAKYDEEGGYWDGRCSRSRDLEGYGGEVEDDLKKLGDAKTCISLKK